MYFDSIQDQDTDTSEVTGDQLTYEEINRIFLEENDDNSVISSPAQVEGYLFAINKLNEEIGKLKALKKQSAEFYANKIESTEKTVEMLKTRIELFMINSDTPRIPTQAGTVYFTKRKKELLPDDEYLIDYSKAYGLPVTVKESPDKKAIKAYIKDGGAIPDGYEVHEVVSLSIRK